MKFNMLAIGSEFQVNGKVFTKLDEQRAMDKNGQESHFESTEFVQMTRNTIFAEVNK